MCRIKNRKKKKTIRGSSPTVREGVLGRRFTPSLTVGLLPRVSTYSTFPRLQFLPPLKETERTRRHNAAQHSPPSRTRRAGSRKSEKSSAPLHVHKTLRSSPPR